MAGIRINNIRFWAPIIFSIPLTIVCFLVGAASAGVGHGDALPLLVLFPFFAVFLTLGDALRFTGQPISGLILIGLLVLQFPLYGLVIAIASQKGKLIRAVTIMIVLHLSIAGYFIYHLKSSH